jgi:hypothetical protein
MDVPPTTTAKTKTSMTTSTVRHLDAFFGMPVSSFLFAGPSTPTVTKSLFQLISLPSSRDIYRIAMTSNPECPTTQSNLYVGGFIAVRALNQGCYPSIGHLIQNQYSARFDVHQGSCSGILCARIMDYHYDKSKEYQQRISAALGDENTLVTKLVRDLVATLPAVSNEHAQVKVTDEMLKELTQWMFENNLQRFNNLSPKEFESVEDIYGMMTKPLADL